jgi:fibronectin-binding autotransporter adhesin
VKIPIRLRVFIVSLLGLQSLSAQSVMWSGATDEVLNTPGNWSGPPANADLIFGPASRDSIDLTASLDVKSVTFSGPYPSYFFTSSTSAVLGIGAGGMTVGAQSGSVVRFDSTISINLSAAETWTTTGSLTLAGTIIDTTPALLTKAGTGELTLNGDSTFRGGIAVQQGRLSLGGSSLKSGSTLVSGASGIGTITLSSGTTLGAGFAAAPGPDTGVQVANDVVLGSAGIGNNVTLSTVVAAQTFRSLTLSGTVTAGDAATTIHLAGEKPVEITGTLTGPANTHLVVDDPGASHGGLVFAGTFSPNILSATADGAALFFLTAPPATLQAVNHGYIGTAITDPTVTPPLSPSIVLSRIAPADRASFAGTFGFDTDDRVLTALNVVSENLDFSAFTHPDFRIGSMTGAVLTGSITPPISGSTSAYRFGGSSGHLVVKSSLGDPSGAPASLLVSTLVNTDASYIVLEGNNTFTGSTTLDGITARIGVERGIAVLDSPGALPAGAASQFTFGANSPAYIGYTEAAGFANFADFTSHLAPGGYNTLSILGLDSTSYYAAKIAGGKNSTDYSPRQITESIDLRSFSSVYLGSASDVVIDGTIFAPANGVLKLTGAGEGTLTINSNFGANVGSLIIGIDGGASREFGNGRVRLLGANTFAGGTTFKSGVLMFGDGTNVSGNAINSGPIGTGTLVIENGVSQATLSADTDGTTVYNPILLNAPLRIGRSPNFGTGSGGVADFNAITLAGAISGANQLQIFGTVNLQAANTYTGGTLISGGQAIFGAASAFGPGAITLTSDNNADNSGLSSALNATTSVVLNQPVSMGGNVAFGSDSGTLELNGPVTLSQHANIVVTSPTGSVVISGAISGSNSLSLNSGSLSLSGNNGFSGGTVVNAGALHFLNATAVPASGLIQVADGGYVGASFTTNLQMGFLNRFDRSGSAGTIGFDSATPITEAIDLSNFNSAVRLGSSSQATLSGVITPSTAGSSYNFGNGGGSLTVLSNLNDNTEAARGVKVNSSPFTPLTLILSGNNTYTAGTTVETSVLRFDSASALPSVGQLDALNYGYIGYTENTGLTVAAFLAKFTSSIKSNAIIGFDSASISSPRTISEAIALTGFNATTYIGTSTAVTLSGPLTPFGAVLNLTGVDGGSLVVNSTISSGAVTIGTPYRALSGSSTVTLNAANTFTGGTTLKYGQLILGNAAALGSGALTIDANGATLATSTPGLAIANNVNFSSLLTTTIPPTSLDGNHDSTLPGLTSTLPGSGSTTNGASTIGTASLKLDATNNFTLSGLISGNGSLSKSGSGSVTLSGLNSTFSGLIQIYEGSMIFSADNSAGTGGIGFLSSGGATASFLSAAPTIGELSGYEPLDQVNLAAGSTLTINQNSDTNYYGSISGNGASLILQHSSTSGSSSLALYGNNAYTGGTTIGNGTTLVAASSGALGSTGPVTLNGGTLGVQSGVTASFSTTHPLVFNNGRLAGNGTLSFSSNLTVHSSAGGTGILSPGFDGRVGTLNFAFNAGALLVLDSGGGYQWKLTDPSKAVGGWDTINVAGNVNITSTAAAPFNFTLGTLDAHGNDAALTTFNLASTYSWTLLTATSIVGFDPTKFSLDTGHFLNPGTFSLTEDATHTSLILNFNPSAVPEPSTWALMITGFGLLAVLSFQRRKSV